MNRSFFLVPALLAVALSAVAPTGCGPDVTPAAGGGDPYPAPLNDPQVSVLALELREWLVFQPAAVVNDGERPLEVQVPMRNLATRSYRLEYRILFYDDDGRELDPVMGWRTIDVDAKQAVRLKAQALDTTAVNYRLEVRWAR